MYKILLCFIALLFVISTTTAFAADQKSAVETVQDFYKQYLIAVFSKPLDVPRPENRPEIAFSKAFAAEMEESDKLCKSHVDPIVCGWGADGDVYLDTQESDPALSYENSGMRVREISPNIVEVKFNLFPFDEDAEGYYNRTIIYHMVLEEGSFVVDNIVYKGHKPESMRERLAQERAWLLNNEGTICLGPNMMFPPYTAEEHVSLTVDGSKQIDFFRQGDPPRIVMSGLDLKKRHVVKVIYQGKVTHSWQLDFRKFKTKLVQIWRSPGYWRMQDACGGACGSALKCR